MGSIRVVFQRVGSLANRREAGRMLARELAVYGPLHPVVLGIPRGGVVVVAEVAAALSAELDVVIAREIGAPNNPELGSRHLRAGPR